jgi:prepilin-type N-terminal cleavage/methylation domain-containing protein
MQKNLSKTSGFTLIELLVVVSVIGVLSGVVISLINSGGFRDKANDAGKIANLKQIQTSLELYFADSRAYPISASWIEVTGSDALLSDVLVPTYINSMPVDTNAGQSNPCGNQDAPRYNYVSDGNDYALTAVMALPSSVEGHECSILNSWGSLGCGGELTNCYGVENP